MSGRRKHRRHESIARPQPRASVRMHLVNQSAACLLWVKVIPQLTDDRCAFAPQQQRFISAAGWLAQCQKPTNADATALLPILIR
jgi:hypothetical protein